MVIAKRKTANTKRGCGTCSVCCSMFYIKALNKPGGTPCKHLHEQGFGCTIYKDRPKACSVYQCVWLQGLGAEQDQPNISGILMDIRQTQFGLALVAKSVTKGAVETDKGRIAIERTVHETKLPCLVVSYENSEVVIGAVGPDDFMKEAMSKGPDIRVTAT